MKKLRAAAALITALTVLITSLTVFASAGRGYDEWYASSWSSIEASKGYVTLTPGADKTQMNFSWQSPIRDYSEKLIVGTSPDLSDGTTLKPEVSLCWISFELTHEATAEKLLPDTTYYYRCTADGTLGRTYSFTTGGTDSTKILFVTDPQIGRYRGDNVYEHDTYGWTQTLETAAEKQGGFDFMICAGDEVEKAYSEDQYTMFESPDLLRSLPVASVIGNHDYYAPNYKYHFNNPNENTPVTFKNPSGNGYYFSYNNALFIVLDSNILLPSVHERIISAACKAYPDTKWRIVCAHHSPYDANASKYPLSAAVRYTIAPLLDKYGVDLYLSGHDHYYSRSYIIRHNAVTSDVSKNDVYTNPSGVLYVSGNSASGSNYYSVKTDAVDKYCDVFHQNNVQNYSTVEITASAISVTTFELNTEKIVDSVTMKK